MGCIGFGDSNFKFAVYIENRPSMFEYKGLSTLVPLSLGEIDAINQCCGNGWRKVFNVYAKLLYALNQKYFNFSAKALTWQAYRDHYLLQAQSDTALLFSAPNLLSSQLSYAPLSSTQVMAKRINPPKKEVVHIICGKGHAKALIKSGKLIDNLVWLDNDFAIDSKNKLIVCPYFDYRQLSDIKIERLSALLLSLVWK
ncbi:MAG: hypothetical protein V5789_08800 [Colwellia sp.]